VMVLTRFRRAVRGRSFQPVYLAVPCTPSKHGSLVDPGSTWSVGKGETDSRRTGLSTPHPLNDKTPAEG